jgi:hypothetical protein
VSPPPFSSAIWLLGARDVADQRDVALQRRALERPLGFELGQIGLGQGAVARIGRVDHRLVDIAFQRAHLQHAVVEGLVGNGDGVDRVALAFIDLG